MTARPPQPAITRPDFSLSSAPEESFAALVPPDKRKRLGQYFTPAPLAGLMAAWVAGASQLQTVLDPAVGLGIFFRALLAQTGDLACRLTGYDVDPQALAAARSLLAPWPQAEARWLAEDYLLSPWDSHYDGILCNPPYLWFQNDPLRRERLQAFEAHLGHPLSGLGNVYSLFLLKALHQLNPGGRAAFLLPQEFLNADYGVLVKAALLRSGLLRGVLRLPAAQPVFEGVLTTTCVLLLAHENRREPVSFMTCETPEELPRLEAALTGYPQTSLPGVSFVPASLEPEVKWRSYYEHRASQGSASLVPLGRYGQARRGIATGDNAFFTLSEPARQVHGLGLECLLPCLTRAAQAQGHFFTLSDFERLRREGKRVYLFDGGDGTGPGVAAYLGEGQALGAAERFLTRRRRPWWALEKRPPAPLLALTFNRQGLRFVRNEAGVRNLTCYHAFYPHPELGQGLDLLMAYLVTDVAGEIFAVHGREYGGGLQKFEPNDIQRALVIDLDALDMDFCTTLKAAYSRYRAAALQGADTLGNRGELNGLFNRFFR